MLKRPRKSAARSHGTATELGTRLDHLHGLVASEVLQHMACALHGAEMSFSQLNTIIRLQSNGAQTIAQLADGADLTHNAASRMVERLTQSGLVERREDAADRRQKQVEITKKGIKRLQDLQAATVSAYADLFVGVPSPVVERLAAALAEARAYLPAHPLSAGEHRDKPDLRRAGGPTPKVGPGTPHHAD
jgi:DNA-binding MarR family transcriptional regulator